MPCYDADMKKIPVTLKGVEWLVQEDGVIFAPAQTGVTRRVRNGRAQEFTVTWPERRAAPAPTKNGYLEVSLQYGGVRRRALVHRLVGMAFVPGADEGLTINHIDGNKLNNHPSNLEWVSLQRNSQHQWETGLVNLRGENAPGSKLTTKRVVYIRKLLQQGVSAHALAIVAGVSQSTIALIRDKKRWAHVNCDET